jgi:hypothetical protein
LLEAIPRDATPRLIRYIAPLAARNGAARFQQRSFILGAHMSIAGGYYKSVEAAAKCAMDCVQLFT